MDRNLGFLLRLGHTTIEFFFPRDEGMGEGCTTLGLEIEPVLTTLQGKSIPPVLCLISGTFRTSSVLWVQKPGKNLTVYEVEAVT